MNNQLLVARVLAGIFVVLFLVALYFVISLHMQLQTSEASTGFAVAHDRINLDCKGRQGVRAPACQQDLQDLSTTLAEFASAVGAPAATTTASTTSTGY